MRKEQFIYEFIDNYFYLVNLNNIVMENYTCKEYTSRSLNDVIKEMKLCLDYYNQLETAVNSGEIDETAAVAKLDYIIAALCSKQKKKLIKDINKCSADCIFESLEDKNNLLIDEKGNEKALSHNTIEQYMIKLRCKEELKMCGNA